MLDLRIISGQTEALPTKPQKKFPFMGQVFPEKYNQCDLQSHIEQPHILCVINCCQTGFTGPWEGYNDWPQEMLRGLHYSLELIKRSLAFLVMSMCCAGPGEWEMMLGSTTGDGLMMRLLAVCINRNIAWESERGSDNFSNVFILVNCVCKISLCSPN